MFLGRWYRSDMFQLIVMNRIYLNYEQIGLWALTRNGLCLPSKVLLYLEPWPINTKMVANNAQGIISVSTGTSVHCIDCCDMNTIYPYKYTAQVLCAREKYMDCHLFNKGGSIAIHNYQSAYSPVTLSRIFYISFITSVYITKIVIWFFFFSLHLQGKLL